MSLYSTIHFASLLFQLPTSSLRARNILFSNESVFQLGKTFFVINMFLNSLTTFFCMLFQPSVVPRAHVVGPREDWTEHEGPLPDLHVGEGARDVRNGDSAAADQGRLDRRHPRGRRRMFQWVRQRVRCWTSGRNLDGKNCCLVGLAPA